MRSANAQADPGAPGGMDPGVGATDDPLANLRDIHLPEPIAWWPPAPGWWVLLGLIAATALIIWLTRRRRADRPRRAALEALAAAKRAYEESDDAHTAIADVSTLLRRFALHHFPGRDVASLTGDEWLQFLDRSAIGSNQFRDNVGVLLTQAPYQPASKLDPSALFAASENWLQNVRNREKKTPAQSVALERLRDHDVDDATPPQKSSGNKA